MRRVPACGLRLHLEETRERRDVLHRLGDNEALASLGSLCRGMSALLVCSAVLDPLKIESSRLYLGSARRTAIDVTLSGDVKPSPSP